MKIFITIVEDRHADTGAYPFSTAQKAVEYAKKCAKEYAHDPTDIEEEEIDGWVYYARYSCEGDSARVVEATLDEAP